MSELLSVSLVLDLHLELYGREENDIFFAAARSLPV